MQKHHWLQHWAISFTASGHHVGGGGGYRGANPVVQLNPHRRIHWLQLSCFFAMSSTRLPKTTHLAKQCTTRQSFFVTSNICPNQLNVFWFIPGSKAWTLAPSTLHLTSALPAKFSHHILPLLRRHWKSSHVCPQQRSSLAVWQKRPCCCRLQPTFDRKLDITPTPVKRLISWAGNCQILQTTSASVNFAH